MQLKKEDMLSQTCVDSSRGILKRSNYSRVCKCETNTVKESRIEKFIIIFNPNLYRVFERTI